MNVIPSSLQPRCPNCQGGLSFTHNKVLTFLTFLSCNGKCKETFELHSAKDMVKFFAATPVTVEAQKINIEKKYLIALRWFKLFYNFYQKDIEGKPSAAMSAMSEDSELQELLREADRIS